MEKRIDQMKHHGILLFGILFGACSIDSPSEETHKHTDSITHNNKEENTIQIQKEQKLKKSDVDFLSVCDSLEIWKGAIQGVPQSDSTGIYVMAQCASNVHFDLIVYSERELSLDEASDRTKGTVKAGVQGATYYAFKIPKRKSINLEEELDTYDYFFPCDVDIYKRFEDGWYLIQTKPIQSVEALGRLKLNTVFNK
jgi:hypothetical protein